jgi:HAD superfamily hydrolase (TIGR01509 family)
MVRRTTLRAIVFDMDGTLLDSHGRVVDAIDGTLRSLGENRRSREEIAACLFTGPARSILTHLLRRAATDEDVAVYHALLAEHAPRAPVYPGIEEALRALATPAAVFTGASIRSAEILLSAAGLGRHFAAIVGGDQVDRVKPAPDGLVMVSGLLGVRPDETAYVGDSPTDLACARAAGSLAVAAGWGELYDPLVVADVVLSDPAELLGLVR